MLLTAAKNNLNIAKRLAGTLLEIGFSYSEPNHILWLRRLKEYFVRLDAFAIRLAQTGADDEFLKIADNMLNELFFCMGLGREGRYGVIEECFDNFLKFLSHEILDDSDEVLERFLSAIEAMEEELEGLERRRLTKAIEEHLGSPEAPCR